MVRQPKKATTDAKSVKLVAYTLGESRHMTLVERIEDAGILARLAFQILRDDLRKRKVCVH